MINATSIRCICTTGENLEWQGAGIGETLEDAFIYRCSQADCGLVFRIEQNVTHKLQDEKDREYNIFKIRHWLAHKFPMAFLGHETIKDARGKIPLQEMLVTEDVLDASLPTPESQVGNLICAMAESRLSQEVRSVDAAHDGLYIGSSSVAIFKQVCMDCAEEGWIYSTEITDSSDSYVLADAILTMKGRRHYHQLKQE